MQKIYISGLIIFLIVSSGFSIKHYGNYSKTEYKDSLLNISKKYFIGIKSIRIYQAKNPYYQAFYFNGGIIDIYGYIDYKALLVHELAHHCQARKEIKSYFLPHDKTFYRCLAEIQNI